MRVLLSGDEYCCRYNGDFYISDHSQVFLNRYLASFETISVVFRTMEVKSIGELGKYKNKVTDSRVRMCYVPFFRGPIQYAKQYFKVKRAAKKAVQGCDIAILRLPSTIAFAVLSECQKHALPYATEIVYDCKDGYETAGGKIEYLLWKTLHKKQVKACNNAIGVSCVTAHYLQQRYFPSSEDAVTSHYSSIEMPPEFLFQARVFPQKDLFSIIHVANQVQFNGRKGHNELIAALAKVRQSGINAQVVFVGEDYCNGLSLLKEYARSLGVEDFVVFTGFLTRKQLREALLSADISVLPTKAEGLPRVIIEAMALGLPCITTPVSGNPELIDKEFLVDYNDVDGIADGIKKLLSNKKLYEQTSKTNFDRSVEYTTDVLNPRRTEFYNKLKALVNRKNN